MKFIKERIEVICKQLEKLSIAQTVPLADFQVKKGCFITPGEADASAAPWEAFEAGKQHWHGLDKHYWFRTKVTVPESFEGKRMALRVHTGLTEWDDGKNPQFLVFIDGKPVQGLDINHRDVVLSESAHAGDSFSLDLQAYTGTLHYELHLIAELEEQDARIQELYYDLLIPLQSLARMNDNERVRWQIETALNETVNLIDMRAPYSEGFYASLERAESYIHKAVYEDLAGCDDIIATCIGHTHIDIAWWWTVEQVRQKSCRSFATVLKLMEEYPGYQFMSSQPLLYEFVKERHPELYAQIKERIAQGRWQPEGGMWVEADCNLTSGESLVRQFLVGKAFFREEFGKDNHILWLPDVFGYSGALPQIMKKCGIDYFMTTKLAWNEYNKIPHDTFLWEGIDGSRVLTHMITTPDVGQPEDKFFTTYNGNLHPDAIMGAWNRYQDKEINNDVLVCYGHGDGGGGPTRGMLEASKRLEKGIRGVPKVRQAMPLEYFRELEERVKGNRRLATWVGELYFEFHRGTYTSMARNKRSNRKSEFGMMNLELFSVMAADLGVNYPKEEIDSLWKIILRNQFHDILPGSCIKEAYDVTKVEYEEIERKTKELIGERIAALAGADRAGAGQSAADAAAADTAVAKSGTALTVFNTLGFEREDIVLLGGTDAKAVTDGERVYPVQQTEDGAIAYLRGLPSKGYVVLREATEETSADSPSRTASFSGATSAFTLSEREIDTPFYHITMDDKAQFTSVYDKENDRELLKEGRVGNELRVYEDKPRDYDNWNIEVYYVEKSYPVDDLKTVKWIEEGPVRATLLVERRFEDCVLSQKIHFYAENRRIDFETYADWKLSDHLLKVHFPLDIHTDEATFDIQFGNVKRKIHQNTSWDEARFESCGQKWADMSEGGYGVSLMNDCKYGYSALDGVFSLTLIKAGRVPNPQADIEEHFFTYSLYPHKGSWQEGGTVEAAQCLNVPAIVAKGAARKQRYSLFAIDCPNVVLETVKRAEDGDGMIVRLYEVENRRGSVTLTGAEAVTAAEETNLLEEALEKQELKVNGNQISFKIMPYEIKTYRIRF